MTSDRFSSSQPDVTFKPAGVGHASGWRCDYCKQPRPMLGRRKYRLGYRCAECVSRAVAPAQARDVIDALRRAA